MLVSIFPVWSDLNLITQIYWAIAIPSTLAFLLLVILSILGSDADTDLQSDLSHSFADGDSIPFQFLSLKNIVGFFAMLGWSGLGFLSAGLPPALVIVLSVICGLMMMLAMASLFYFMSKLAESGNMKMKNAIGHVGQVYLLIPGKRQGMGKIQITIQGAIQTLDAVTDDADTISNASLVVVEDVIDGQILLVKKES